MLPGLKLWAGYPDLCAVDLSELHIVDPDAKVTLGEAEGGRAVATAARLVEYDRAVVGDDFGEEGTGGLGRGDPLHGIIRCFGLAVRAVCFGHGKLV